MRFLQILKNLVTQNSQELINNFWRKIISIFRIWCNIRLKHLEKSLRRRLFLIHITMKKIFIRSFPRSTTRILISSFQFSIYAQSELNLTRNISKAIFEPISFGKLSCFYFLSPRRNTKFRRILLERKIVSFF